MNDEQKNLPEQEEEEIIVYPLTDEETGKTQDFELLAEWRDGEKLYYAMAPADDESFEGYVVLRVTEDEEGLTMESIEDDDEFDRVADYFDDLFMDEIDYDAQ